MPQGLSSLFREIANGEHRFLKLTFLSGAILALLTGGTLIFFSLRRAADPVPAGDTVYRSLREYDAAARGVQAREDPERLSRMLDRLEEKALGVELHLSILKRRRALARIHPRFISTYQEAARKAAAAYPYSEPLAALAAASLLPGIFGNTGADMRKYASLLSAAQFSPLKISLHILLGDFKSPQSAAALPRINTALADALPSFRGRVYPQAEEALTADLAILKLLEGDTGGAAADIQGGLYEAGDSGGGLPETFAPSPEFLRFAAEYLYDFGDPLLAAELFSRLDTEMDMIRQADALWLSGRPENARHIWALLVSPAGENLPREVSASPAPGARALYNLALTSADDREAAALLERLTALPIPGPDRRYGIIRRSRLLDTPRSLALLEQALKEFPTDPLLELELLRRRSGPGPGGTWETGRVIGETWLLLGRHPESEELYHWGAWYFDYQRQWDETAKLLNIAARRRFDSPWISFHEALGNIERGNLNRAEELLLAIPPETAGWPVFANLGRILEARLAPEALEYYETAASAVQNREEAARIQIRIAQCLKILGRDRESRRALEYALDLDPGNLKARLELHRLDNPAN
jgi:tetratricopeptide (TPR) repeat protein